MESYKDMKGNQWHKKQKVWIY